MIHFVGAGPGAKDLITVRGAELIKNADVIIYTGSLVNKDLLAYAKKEAKVFDSSKLTLEEVMDIMLREEETDQNIVRLHTGEPSLYGAVREQMDILDDKGISYDSCPGVSACFGAAASLDMEYTLPGISQTLIITRMEGKTPVPESESIKSLAAHNASMAVYLSTGMLKELSEELIAGEYKEDTPAAIVYKATWDDEKKYVCTVGTLYETAEEHDIKKTAVILVGDAVSKKGFKRSKLYDPDFETEFREKKN